MLAAPGDETRLASSHHNIISNITYRNVRTLVGSVIVTVVPSDDKTDRSTPTTLRNYKVSSAKLSS